MGEGGGMVCSSQRDARSSSLQRMSGDVGFDVVRVCTMNLGTEPQAGTLLDCCESMMKNWTCVELGCGEASANMSLNAPGQF